MPKVRLESGLNVHYQRVGTGPDLAMIHGLGGNLAVWHLKIVPLLWEQFNILTYDLRGHGYTEITESGYTPTELATDLKQLLDALDIAQVDVVGHSYGADIALYFAYLYPERVRRVVVIEAIIPALVQTFSKEELEGRDWLANVLEKFGFPIPEDRRYDGEFLIREALKVPRKWGPLKDLPGDSEHMVKLYGTTSILKDAAVIGDMTLKNVPQIQAPVHLIYDAGSLGWLKSYRFLRKSLPHVTSVLLPKSEFGHFVPLEQPELTTRHILKGLLPKERVAGK